VAEEQFAELIRVLTVGGSILMSVAAVVSGLYVIYVYRNRYEEAPFLTRLVHRDVRVSTASTVILVYLAFALSGVSLGPPWGGLLIAIAVWTMEYGPIEDAITWWRERRAYGKAPLTTKKGPYQ
jgi:hypothetical protein